MMPTPGFWPPRFALLYDIVVQVVLALPSYVFGTSSGCSSPLPSGFGSKSLAPTILAWPPVADGVVLVCGGALLFAPPLLLSWSLFIAPLSRNCAIAMTDSSARIASRMRIRPPQEPFGFGSSCRRRPFPFDGGGGWRRTGRVSAAALYAGCGWRYPFGSASYVGCGVGSSAGGPG